MYTENNNWKQLLLNKNFNLCYMYSDSDGPHAPNFVHGPYMRNHSVFQYVSAGRGRIVVDDREYDLKAGDFIAISPGQICTEYADGEDPWAFMWVEISGESVDNFAEMIKSNPVIYNCGDTRIPILFHEMSQLGDFFTQPQRSFKLASKIFDLLDELVRLSMSRQNISEIKYNRYDYVNQAIYYMESRYHSRDFSIDSIAKAIGLNRSYLYKIFKAEVGISPQQYLTRLRINKACENLLLPQATVTSVACSVGYEPLVFSRTFKRIIGMNPSEYRERNMG